MNDIGLDCLHIIFSFYPSIKEFYNYALVCKVFRDTINTYWGLNKKYCKFNLKMYHLPYNMTYFFVCKFCREDCISKDIYYFLSKLSKSMLNTLYSEELWCEKCMYANMS